MYSTAPPPHQLTGQLFICVAFKSHTEWSNAHVSTSTTKILGTIVGIFHGLNCFGRMVCKLACSKTLQNLIYPCISFHKFDLEIIHVKNFCLFSDCRHWLHEGIFFFFKFYFIHFPIFLSVIDKFYCLRYMPIHTSFTGSWSDFQELQPLPSFCKILTGIMKNQLSFRPSFRTADIIIFQLCHLNEKNHEQL